jgi:hypothetical protein
MPCSKVKTKAMVGERSVSWNWGCSLCEEVGWWGYERLLSALRNVIFIGLDVKSSVWKRLANNKKLPFIHYLSYN